MLETADRDRLTQMLAVLPCRVEIPAKWTDFFDQSGFAPSMSDERRRFARVRIRSDAVCEVMRTLPAIERQHALHRIYLCDISRSGISFLNAIQLFPCEEIVLWTSSAKVKAVVRRCVKVCENGYQIGAHYV